jgi:hypothetical protein
MDRQQPVLDVAPDRSDADFALAGQLRDCEERSRFRGAVAAGAVTIRYHRSLPVFASPRVSPVARPADCVHVAGPQFVPAARRVDPECELLGRLRVWPQHGPR